MEKYPNPCYCTNARHCANNLTDLYNEALKAIGLTVPQYYLLAYLALLGKANITAWAECVGLDRSTMVRNIRHLVDAELVERTDGSGKTYRLSSKGEAIMGDARQCWKEAQHKVRDFLGEEDAKAFLRISKKLQGMA